LSFLHRLSAVEYAVSATPTQNWLDSSSLNLARALQFLSLMSKQDSSRASPRPTLIDGIYHYCDRWCERCRFQTRCRLYRDTERMEAIASAGLDAKSAVEAFADDADDDDDDETDEEAATGKRAAFLAALEAATREPSPEQARRLDAALDRRSAQEAAHPLTLEAGEYAQIARGLSVTLRSILARSADPVALASLETIDHFSMMIAVKTRRAVGSLIALQEPDDELDDAEFSRLDGNGSAKLVRLMIAESRDAWNVLMQIGSVAADGVPVAMAKRLERLDASVANAFPRAMSFVRAGFDDEGGGS
jgi:hypothetical protein